MRPAIAVLAFALVAPLEARAQSKAIGKWLVRYEHEVRIGHMGAVTSSIVVDTAHLTLRQKGDSILGEWQAASPAGENAPAPKTLLGVVHGEAVQLEVDPSIARTDGYFSELGREIVEYIKEHVHGISPMTTRLELTARGDSLVGTRWSSSPDGTRETSRRSVVAIREKQ